MHSVHPCGWRRPSGSSELLISCRSQAESLLRARALHYRAARLECISLVHQKARTGAHWSVCKAQHHCSKVSLQLTGGMCLRARKSSKRSSTKLHSAVGAAAVVASGWPLWCFLAACAAGGQVAEERTEVGRIISAPLVSMLAAAALAAGGVIPADCPDYNVVWTYLMPMAAACFLLETDFSKLWSTGGPILVSFLIGSVGMVAGAVLGGHLLAAQMGPYGAQLAACLCASYIGGFVNFAAVAQVVTLQASAIPTAMAADSLAMAALLALMMAIPVANLEQRFFQEPAHALGASADHDAAPTAPPATSLPPTSAVGPVHDQRMSSSAAWAMQASSSISTLDGDSVSHSSSTGASSSGGSASLHGSNTAYQAMGTSPWRRHSHSTGHLATPASSTSPSAPASVAAAPMTSEGLAVTFAAAAAACAAGKLLSQASGQPSLNMLLMAVVAVGISLLVTLLQRSGGLHPSANTWSSGNDGCTDDRLSPFTGASQLGAALMSLFFAIIGAGTSSISASSSLGTGVAIVAFIFIMVAVHWLVLVVIGAAALCLPRVALLLGSNACIGGPGTAAAMASSRGWTALVQPAMLSGSLGYAVGTGAGLLVARLLI